MTRTLLMFLALAGLFLVTATASAADETPSFKKRGDAEKQFVAKAGTAVVKAARSKPQKVALLSYEYTKPKANRTELTIKMEYYGLISMKRFIADMTFIIDSTDKDSWEVLNIRYSDNNPNPVGPSEKKIQALIKDFNK
jgi:hypothetical protein